MFIRTLCDDAGRSSFGLRALLGSPSHRTKPLRASMTRLHLLRYNLAHFLVTVWRHSMADTPVAIVASTFHRCAIETMLACAKTALINKHWQVHSIVRVPGCYEKPLAVKRLLARDDVAAIVVLGIIERGETAHGRVMGQIVSDTLVRLQLEFMKPIGLGIIGPEANPDQLAGRLEPYALAAVDAVAAMLHR